jgi:hypothetical protein
MANTSRDKLRYPIGADAPNVPLDIQNLATDVENLRAFLLARQVKDTGQLNHTRAGRQLAVTDFTTDLGLATPVGLFNLGGLTNLGSGAALVNKGTVPFAPGITGAASEAALFAGSTAQALYIADTGAADPFRLKTGSWGCWCRTAKRGVTQAAISKWNAVAATRSLYLSVGSANVAVAQLGDGTTAVPLVGTTDVADDRWHHLVVTADGTNGRLYVDGVLEAIALSLPLTTGASAPLNIGGYGADGATVAGDPHFGRVDEAFVTPDVLSIDEVRLLMCVKLAHGFVPGALSRSVRRAGMTVRRYMRGGPLVTGDFPVTPLRLHNFTAAALTDAGSNNVAVAPVGGGTIIDVAGADGVRSSGQSFSGAHTGLGSTDTGLPSGTTSRSYGCWFKTSTAAGGMGLLGWGTVNTADARIAIVSGLIGASSGPDGTSAGPLVADGTWHHAVVVEDNAAADGVKRKLYVDGRVVATSTVLTSLTLAGANRFRVGTNPDGSAPFTGQIDGVFVAGAALTAEQVMAIYQKQGRDMGFSPKAPGDHIEKIDDTNIYVLCDTLEPQHTIDLEVAA